MILPKLKGRGLFIFSDPGGAKPVLSLITLSGELTGFKIISDRVYDFFDDFNLTVEPYIPGIEETIFKEFRPDFIYTGTSYTSKIELLYIEAAKKKGIPTYAFIDHYTNFLERFKIDEKSIYPNHFCVLDTKALNIAIENNIPFENIIITGNPYHLYLKNWTPAISKEDFFIQSGIALNNKLILFAPDPLTNIGGKEKFGLDETTVLTDLYSVLDKIISGKLNITLGLKFHPNQKMANIKPFIHDVKNVNTITCNTFDTNTLLFHSDVVVGMFSNILIETSILKTKMIRHLNKLIQPDPLLNNNVGIVTNNNFELEQVLFNILSN